MKVGNVLARFQEMIASQNGGGLSTKELWNYLRTDKFQKIRLVLFLPHNFLNIKR